MKHKNDIAYRDNMLADGSTLSAPSRPIQLDATPLKDGGKRLYQSLFLGIVLLYCYFYAPVGFDAANGEIAGLAWQVLQGNALYSVAFYAQPPLPVWLQALEIALLPDFMLGIFERYAFFAKVAIYTWLAASLCTVGANRYILATLAFIVSVHCFPPAASAIVDGLLFSVASIWFLQRENRWTSFVGGFFVMAAWLCHTSFWLYLPIFLVFLTFSKQNKRQKVLALAGFGLGLFAWVGYLSVHGLWENYTQQVGTMANVAPFLHQGILAYLELDTALLLFALCLSVPVLLFFKNENKIHSRLYFAARAAWAIWLLGMLGAYFYEVLQTRSFLVPFTQSRLLLLIAGFYLKLSVWAYRKEATNPYLIPFALLILSWASSVNPGYPTPLLFAVPLVFVQMEIGRRLFELAGPYFQNVYRMAGTLMAVFLLMTTFRLAYEFPKNEMPRSYLNENVGSLFPRMTGICTSTEQMEKLKELDRFLSKYEGEKVFLPEQTNSYLSFVVNKKTVLPDRLKILDATERMGTVLLLDKENGGEAAEHYLAALGFRTKIAEEGDHFAVLSFE